ncbi:hypothetical protein HHX38_26205 [Streptomyces sp. PKU-MA01144]|uniref:hypothetical protein n=1 Tax=Streptomyces sp. PKU-MA01144 TaxID=2729138 RepID=UPI001481858E|nr:hypothetical protein [Streptomyces sp. PKU-MA01144]NNJ07596.1 hypothetical protein [Streptomyces sp. PKU-MA01144]
MILIAILPPLLLAAIGAFLLFGPEEAAAKFISMTSVTGAREASKRARMTGAGLFPIGITVGAFFVLGEFDMKGPLAGILFLSMFAACATAIVLFLLWNNRRND